MRIDTFVVFSFFLLSIYPENVKCSEDDDFDKPDSLESQGKNEAIGRKLKEAIQDILINYQTPKDLKLKSTFTLSIALPAGIDEAYITDVVNKTFENILSTTFAPSRTGFPLSVVNFRLKTYKNEKGKNDGVRTQNILVTFDVPNIDSNGECVTSDNYKNDTWCSGAIKWNFAKSMKNTRMKHIQRMDKGFSFDFNDPLWAHLRSWMKSSRSHDDDTEMMKWHFEIANINEKRRKREINSRGIIIFDYNNPQWEELQDSLEVQIASQEEKACLTIDIKSRKHAWYDEWMLMTMEMNSYISQIDSQRSIKYLANPVLLECKSKTLRLNVHLLPTNEKLKNELEVLRFTFNTIFLPLLKSRNPQSNFRFISAFNAVDRMKQKATDNTGNVVVEVFNAHRNLKLTCDEINEIFDRVKECMHTNLDSNAECEKVIRINTDKEYYIVKFRLGSSVASDEDCPDNFPNTTPGDNSNEISTPETPTSGIETTTKDNKFYETTTIETIPVQYKTTTENSENWKTITTNTFLTPTKPSANTYKTTTLNPLITPTKPGTNTYKTTTPNPLIIPTKPGGNTYKTTTPNPFITTTKPGANTYKTTTLNPFITPTKPGPNTYKTTTSNPFLTPTKPDENSYKTTTPKTLTTDVSKTTTPGYLVPDRNATLNCTNKSYIFIKIITEEMFPILFEKFPNSELIFKKQWKTPEFCQLNQYWSIEMKFDNRPNSAPTDAATLKAMLNEVFRIFEYYCKIEYDLSEAIFNRKRVKIFICFQYLPGHYCRSDTSTRDALIIALLENPLQLTQKSTLSKCPNIMKYNDTTYESPESQLVQQIVLEKILPIFCAVYPSSETKTEITRVKDSSEDVCHPDTFNIVVEVMGRKHFRYETVKYMELLFTQLEEIHTKMTAACFLNGGMKTGSNVQTTIRMKVAKLNGNCVVPKDEEARTCSSDEEVDVSRRHLIPAGI